MISSARDAGPTFGLGDLHIDVTHPERSFSNLGFAYQLPVGTTFGSATARDLIAGGTTPVRYR